MINTARDIRKAVLELVYPTRCGGCGEPGEVLCELCRQSFVAVEGPGLCPVCGRRTGSERSCGACMTHRRYFDEGFYGFAFDGALREAVHAFKFRGRIDVGRALARMAAPRVATLAGLVDALVPLPVTEKRLRSRGFNQSFIICEELARVLAVPIDHTSLRKVKATEDQYTLSKEARKRNVRGAFAADGPVEGMRLLLVDDLYTTGNTATEAARTLKKAGAASIRFFALARTP